MKPSPRNDLTKAGVRAKRRSDPLLAGRRRVALVEHQVDHFEHRSQALAKLVATRDLERHACLGERALGADDALRDRPLGGEERPCDLRGREATQ